MGCRVLIAAFNPDQAARYESLRRVRLKKETVRKVHNFRSLRESFHPPFSHVQYRLPTKPSPSPSLQTLSRRSTATQRPSLVLSLNVPAKSKSSGRVWTHHLSHHPKYPSTLPISAARIQTTRSSKLRVLWMLLVSFHTRLQQMSIKRPRNRSSGTLVLCYQTISVKR